MNYDWYLIFNVTEFAATGLVSRELSLLFPRIGTKTILITRAFFYSIVVDDIFLTIGVNDRNPFEFEDRAVYVDSDYNVWLGILHAS